MSTPHVLFAGRTTLDAVYFLDEVPPEDTKVFARAFRMAPGGPACNAAITHAQLGGRATLLSAVGRGPTSEIVRRELERHSIRLIDFAGDTDHATPLTTVLVNSTAATRTIVNPPAAQLPVDALPGAWPASWGEPPQLALTDGFHLAETLPLLASLHDSGCRICLDGGNWKPATDKLAPLLTAAICSERFVAPGALPSADSTLAWFAAQGVPYAAVTRGARSILAADRARRFEVEIESVPAIDTLGAGDVLHGAFCFYFAAGRDFEHSLRRAAEIATRSCRGMGVNAWSETETC